MTHTARRRVFALMLSAAVATPALAHGVSAAPSQGGTETLVYHSSWQTGTLDWKAHAMKWSISGGILKLLPMRSDSDGTGWLVAPYHTTRQESFAVEAVIRVSQAHVPPVGWGWAGWVGLIAHAGSRSWADHSGVNGECWYQNSARIDESADPAYGSRGVSTPLTVHMGQWNTYRLEVRYNSSLGQDMYTYRLNGVALLSSALGDWMQNNRIALNTNMGLEVKALNVYRLR